MLRCFLILLQVCGSVAHTLVAGTEATKPVIPNIGYLFRGYHLYHGNPLATQVTADPGFLSLIFEPSYEDGLQSSDLNYKIPDGTRVYTKEGCTQAFNNDLLQSSAEYQRLLKDIVKTNYTGFDHSFRGSSDFQQVDSAHSVDSSSQLLLTQILCLKYEAVLDTAEPPPYSSIFISDLLNMYAIYQRDSTNTDAINLAIHNLLNSYGTHFVRKIEMGSRFSFQSSLTSNERYELEQAGLNMRTGAVLSMTRQMGHQLTEEELEHSRIFDRLVTDRRTSSSLSYNSDGRLDLHSSTPIPLYYEIERLDGLFVRSYMKTVGVDYRQIKILLEAYFADYCANEEQYSGQDQCGDAAGDSADSAAPVSQHNFKVIFPETGEGSSTNSILWRNKIPELRAITISFWMKTPPYTQDTDKRRHIVSYNYNNLDLIKVLAGTEAEGGCLMLELDGGRVTQPLTTCLIPFDNNFHHYVVVWCGMYGRWQVYVDGNIMSGGSHARGYIIPEGGYIVIGQQHNTGTVIDDPLTAFRGEIAYMNIWNFVVNGVEARKLADDNGRVQGSIVSWDQTRLKFNGDSLDITAVVSSEEFFKA